MARYENSECGVDGGAAVVHAGEENNINACHPNIGFAIRRVNCPQHMSSTVDNNKTSDWHSTATNTGRKRRQASVRLH